MILDRYFLSHFLFKQQRNTFISAAIVTARTVGQRFLLIKKRWENEEKNVKNAFFKF